MAEARGQSPLGGVYADVLEQGSATGQVWFAELPFQTQIGLRTDPKGPAVERIGAAIGATPPTEPGEVAVAGELSVLWMGPDEWLVVGPERAHRHVQSALRSALGDEHGAVTDLSAHRTTIAVRGPRARDVLSKGCAIDLHPRRFGRDRCAQTLLARAQVILVCLDQDIPDYRLLVRSSFARYVADWLTDAAAEYREHGAGA
ncbi:sarcosine oxidase subunit gamma [Spinactinospora alkalitolerans]|uniref:Sarcosine oxidase subunit gamma n=1 Tax=Spinactinospora alkalitolerans TaxID=687207 RepID=A0A852TVS0_9ACTN|nr:sarcosine oxidase subunit gamma family protein [Spinactinospora alkalitolerans]NYE48028.1 sarcosine oxidase subunit gamma [Spinactinospora alkalitolerans]